MKKSFINTLSILLNINFLYADDRSSELNHLFNELKIKDKNLSFEVEQQIWKIWSTHPNNNRLTSMLAAGSNFMNNNEYSKAVEFFTKAIDLDPTWAEAWNKRASVLYIIGEFEKSQNDIDQVLKLEKRHFGALAGQGLVNIELENYEKALESYKEAMRIYPTMNSPKIMIKQIKELIQRQSI